MCVNSSCCLWVWFRWTGFGVGWGGGFNALMVMAMVLSHAFTLLLTD
jgi:4-amino-4-deoxy-L-arabinose transferase-like glycosyltransferase